MTLQTIWDIFCSTSAPWLMGLWLADAAQFFWSRERTKTGWAVLMFGLGAAALLLWEMKDV